MAKKLEEESAKQPIRQSRRTRVLNTRLGTPPKILLDMLGDHSSSGVPEVAAIEIGECIALDVVLLFLVKSVLL